MVSESVSGNDFFCSHSLQLFAITNSANPTSLTIPDLGARPAADTDFKVKAIALCKEPAANIIKAILQFEER